ncbi:MAG TPA: methyltransferase domain-containing protein [Verrucomicrobiae bacterium]|nr:methyltransferase domain-containing protein [Verrucomicrobiae bacterium]
MTGRTTPLERQPGLAFDTIAEQYDDIFTHSLIGRAQRDAVWHVLKQTFRAGDHILELNCGTGEDALFLAQMGVSVFACDVSEKMIAVAARRIAKEPRGAQVHLEVRPTEQIDGLRNSPFDGAFSNFSGLNCVIDLAQTARQLAALVKPRGRLVLCLSTRFCLWETLWYLAHHDLTRAARRWRGKTSASLGDIALEIRYPTMRDMRKLFAPAFSLRRYKGIGVAVPPSYVEHLAAKYPRALKGLQAIDRAIATWPGYRAVGDHMLLVLERNKA